MSFDLNLSNVITVQISATQAGIGRFNTSNIGLFTHETFGGSFGSGSFKIYLDPSDVIKDFGSDSVTAQMAVGIFSQKPNILLPGGYLVIMPFLDDNETIEAAVVRMQDTVQFFGVLSQVITNQADMESAAAYIQTQNKMAFWPSNLSADVQPGGKLDLLRTGSLNQNRGLFYGGTETEALVFSAAYAGRALSTDFTGSNTTQTMHLKDMVGIQPDPVIDQTLLTACKTAGVDVYVSLQGVPKVFTSGANGFFDSVYNLQAFVGDIIVSGFNTLATVNTKIPQTEAGMDILKGGYRKVAQQYVSNAYIAPGEWNSPSTFGNLNDFLRNIRETGFYIFSTPVALQNAPDRAARKAPLAQIAVKEAGAVHSANIIINVNA